MKFLFISILFSVIFVSTSLRQELTGTRWTKSSSSFYESIQDSIFTKTSVLFNQEEILFCIQVEHKLDTAVFNLKTYVENGTVFKVQIGKRKKEGFLYGFYDSEKMQLSLLPTNFDLSLDKNILDYKVTDSIWMVYDKEE